MAFNKQISTLQSLQKKMIYFHYTYRHTFFQEFCELQTGGRADDISDGHRGTEYRLQSSDAEKFIAARKREIYRWLHACAYVSRSAGGKIALFIFIIAKIIMRKKFISMDI